MSDTPNLGLHKQDFHDLNWHTPLNENFDLIDAAVQSLADAVVGVLTPDMFTATVTGTDADLDGTLSIGQSGFTLPLAGEKTGGFLSAVCIPINMDALGEFEFVIVPARITQDYLLIVLVMVTNLDGTEKILLGDNYPVVAAQSGVPLTLNDVVVWGDTLVGTDLAFTIEDVTLKVQSTAGGIYTAELMLTWFAK